MRGPERPRGGIESDTVGDKTPGKPPEVARSLRARLTLDGNRRWRGRRHRAGQTPGGCVSRPLAALIASDRCAEGGVIREGREPVGGLRRRKERSDPYTGGRRAARPQPHERRLSRGRHDHSPPTRGQAVGPRDDLADEGGVRLLGHARNVGRAQEVEPALKPGGAPARRQGTP